MNILDGPQSRDPVGATQQQPLRKLGIPDVEDVPWGTHICQVYTTQADLLEILTPYFSEGLKSNECCLWITAEPLGVAAAKAALCGAVPHLDAFLASGQIEIIHYREWRAYLDGFERGRARAAW